MRSDEIKNKQKVIDFLDQIIDHAEQEDKLHKLQAIQRHKASEAIGESWMVFHLKALKQLIEE